SREAALLHGLLERVARREFWHPRGSDVDLLAGRWVATFASTTVSDAELAEAGEDGLTAALERVLDGLQSRIDGVSGIFFAQPGAIRDLVDKLGLRHLRPPSRW